MMSPHDHEHEHHGEHEHEHDEHEHEHEHSAHSHDEHEHSEHSHDEHDGHNHSHHDHNHDHSHGDHEHDDHEHNHQLADGEVSISTHEEAIIASVTFTRQGDLQDHQLRLATLLEELAAAVSAAGGFVGHIKATINTTETVMLSNTGAQTNIINNSAPQAKIDVVAIVFNIPESQLKTLFENRFSSK